MGPRRTPHKQREPGNYEALGKVGRRTGATLKDTGVRDEHGFEPIPSFSSPTKSLFQANGNGHDGTNSAEDSMDIDQSTIPEPAEMLQSSRKGRISLPPKATSPIKTHLNSSPRRSMARSVGPLSSPSRNSNNDTPTRANSHPPVNRSADRLFNMSSENIRESVEKSPRTGPVAQRSKEKVVPNKGKGKGKKVFDLSGRASGHDESGTEALDETNLSNGVINDDDSIILTSYDQHIENSTFDQGTLETDQTDGQAQDLEAENSEMMAPPADPITRDPGKQGGRAPKTMMAELEGAQISTSESGQKRRGRPRRKPEIYQDPDAHLAAPASPAPKTKRPPPPSERDPNARGKTTKTEKGKPPSRAGSVAAGPRFVQRSETPANDSGALITRFGRQSIKPLATWRGEKTVMGDRTLDALPGIKEVIRVDEIVEARPKQRYRKGRYRARPKLEDLDEEEPPEEEREAWEIDPGIIVAKVMDWDADNNRYDEENSREDDVAYSHEAIQMRDVKGAGFKFAKTLTLDFFGSGMVHLLPGGAKRIKNSRKMQMVFFVFYGRVTVSIGTPPTQFSIGKGGQWQVPRGNFYSITNESETNDARMFFAQGCEIHPGAVDESTMA